MSAKMFFMVMFETPTREEVFFHYSEGIADWLFK
jgi:hypothetical protein